ncbi:MAG: hypothetical protein FWF97_03560 [Alphaproteobacteria bacterium]|nr:hypothetical protein [Alphaproteobacteria bacterium]
MAHQTKITDGDYDGAREVTVACNGCDCNHKDCIMHRAIGYMANLSKGDEVLLDPDTKYPYLYRLRSWDVRSGTGTALTFDGMVRCMQNMSDACPKHREPNTEAILKHGHLIETMQNIQEAFMPNAIVITNGFYSQTIAGLCIKVRSGNNCLVFQTIENDKKNPRKTDEGFKVDASRTYIQVLVMQAERSCVQCKSGNGI